MITIIIITASMLINIGESFQCNQVIGPYKKNPNTPSIASCPATQTLLSCGISGTQALWGTYIDPANPNSCIVNTDSTSWGVKAVAVCCTFPSGSIKSIITIENEDQNNLQVVTQCPSNSVLTGCQVNRQSGTVNQIRGVYSGQKQSTGSAPLQSAASNPISTQNQCIAEGRQNGINLRGGAQCVQLNPNYQLDCVATGKYTNKDGFNGQCPTNYQLVSCMTWTPSSTLDKWHYTQSRGCYVQQDGHRYQHANGICCRLTKVSTPTPTRAPSTPRPTPIPPKTSTNYIKGTSPMKYTDAVAYCESQDTTLASIGNIIDWNEAKSLCEPNFCWIGLRGKYNSNSEAYWTWDDGIDITKSYGFLSDGQAARGQEPWSTDNPDNVNYECVIMLDDGKYADDSCGGSLTAYALCNIVRTSTQHVSHGIQREYFRGPSRVNYDAAQKYCQSQGTALATIRSGFEWHVAEETCRYHKYGWANTDCWIGLKNDNYLGSDRDQSWNWGSGIRISTSFGFNPDRTAKKGEVGTYPWDLNEPSNSGYWKDCVVMSHENGKYQDSSCQWTAWPLCTKVNGANANSDHNLMDILYDGKNRSNGLSIIQIKGNIFWIVCGLMIINMVCLTIYCWNKCIKIKNKQGYNVVNYESENTEI